MKKIFILGAGSHAKNIETLINKETIFLDKSKNIKNSKEKNDEFFFREILKKKIKYELYMGIGNPNYLRIRAFKNFKKKGAIFKKFIHKQSYIAKNLKIGEGSVIFPNVTIGNNVNIGNNCIIYSNSVIEHDSVISNHCYIAPSATICGNVKIEEGSFVGANACIVENIFVKKKSFVKANSLIKKDIIS